MPLSNYTRSLSRKNGGIRLLGLIDQSELASATYTAADGGYSAITLDDACFFAKYEFREDEAEYKESVSIVNGARIVNHELTFLLDKMGNDTTKAITNILDVAQNGLIAIIRTMNGDSFLIGYSTEFLKERPLRVAAVNGTTGKLLAEGTNEIITLRCQDVAKAKPFTGELESLFASTT